MDEQLTPEQQAAKLLGAKGGRANSEAQAKQRAGPKEGSGRPKDAKDSYRRQRAKKVPPIDSKGA